MDYFGYNGQQSERGIELGKIITSKVVDILSGIDFIKDKEVYLTNLFYDLCHNDELLYRLHKQYCEEYSIYSSKYKEVPFSPKLRSQVFQIMTSVLNYEITKYKILNSSKFKKEE